MFALVGKILLWVRNPNGENPKDETFLGGKKVIEGRGKIL